MKKNDAPASARWARLRFAVVGQLLVDPPEHGGLQARLRELASRTWRHPTTGAPVQFGASTIERWYYQARNAGDDTVKALGRRVRSGAGEHPCVARSH